MIYPCVSSSIQTILSVSELHRFGTLARARGLYRRWGIAPRPEDTVQFLYNIARLRALVKWQRLCYNKIHYRAVSEGVLETEGVVAAVVGVAALASGILKPRICPLAEVSVISPPIISFL